MTKRERPDQLDPKIAEAIAQRMWTRPATYQPWDDLRTRTGVDLLWHIGQVGHFDRPLGVTDFSELSVTLRADLGERQLRCTVAHELLHLERGPASFTGLTTAKEEAKVHLLASQRLVDPVLFDLLKDVEGGPASGRALIHVLGVDRRTLRVWSDWRAKVKMSTAMRKFEEFHPDNLPLWPAAWITHKRAPLAHLYAAARRQQ